MLHALFATLLAAARLAGLTSAGALLLRRSRDPSVALPLALLLGAAVIGAMDAVLLAFGARDLALIADVAAMAAGMAGGGARTLVWARALGSRVAGALSGRRWVRAIAAAIAAVYWINAATPPRDTDSLRYHLAHIAQIDREGRWVALPIVHYALPFAWEATYLPLLHLGAPEAAQLVNAGALALLLAAIVAREPEATRSAPWPLLLVAVTPAVVTNATTASADMPLALAATVTLLALSSDPLDERSAFAAGFAGWVGMGSRYQAAAVGIATVILLARHARSAGVRRVAPAFIGGSCLALLLASPFYVVNARAFSDPVWPLLADHVAPHGYSTRIAVDFSRAWHGSLAPRAFAAAVVRFLTDRNVFPLPLLAAGGALVASRIRGPRRSVATPLATFVALFFVVWALAQPMLYPRFILYLLGPTLWMWTRIGARVAEHRRVGRLVAGVAAALAVAMSAYVAAFTWVPLRYLVGGSAAAFERYTWYRPVLDWANDSLPSDSRVLVLLRSGESFGLNRWYRRADPYTSAVIDWRTVAERRSLTATLDSAGFTHLIVDGPEWGGGADAAAMLGAIRAAADAGALREVKRFQLSLTRSRFLRGREIPATVLVYERARPPGPGQPAVRP